MRILSSRIGRWRPGRIEDSGGAVRQKERPGGQLSNCGGRGEFIGTKWSGIRDHNLLGVPSVPGEVLKNVDPGTRTNSRCGERGKGGPQNSEDNRAAEIIRPGSVHGPVSPLRQALGSHVTWITGIAEDLCLGHIAFNLLHKTA